MKAAILTLAVILSITVKVNGLQCYVCYDCEKPTDESLLTCANDTSNLTIISSSTTESATNSSSTTTTISPTAPDTNATDTNATSEVEANMTYKGVERADTYECFWGTIKVSETTVTVRGCAVNPTNNSCAATGLSDCKLCTTDKCNGATAVHSSAALLCLLYLGLLLKE